MSVVTGSIEVSVYVMRGEILAAEASDDSELYIRRLTASGDLPIARRRELGAMAQMGEPVLGVLLEDIDGGLMEPILADRFRDNLSRYLGAENHPNFTPLSAVFVENIQMGHDSRGLIERCAGEFELAIKVLDSTELVPFDVREVGGDKGLVLSYLEPGRTVGAILPEIPLEPTYARALLGQMLDEGLVTVGADPADFDNEDDDDPDSRNLAPEPADADDVDADSMVLDDDRPLTEDRVETEIMEPELRGQLPRVAHEDPPTAETEVVEHSRQVRRLGDIVKARRAGDSLNPDTTPAAAATSARHVVTGPAPADVTGGVGDDEEEEDRETLDFDLTPVVDLSTAGGSVEVEGEFNLDVGGWLADVEVDESEMEAFGDYDRVRGEQAEGAFSTDAHNLDRVEVGAPPAAEPDWSASAGTPEPDRSASPAEPEADPADAFDDEEVLEAEEAPSTKYAARALTEDQARSKIDVVNGVLAQVVEAFDSSEGAGRGQATLQLLVDGSPNRFAALFHDVRVTDTGILPHVEILRNLHHRPQSEHRQLLNMGLVDLIERAISLAMDEITDDGAIDALLERTAGYRQRIGL